MMPKTPTSFPFDLSCPVCLAIFQKPVSLSCGHSMCLKCAEELIIEGILKCPVDGERFAMRKQDLHLNYHLTALMEHLPLLSNDFAISSEGDAKSPRLPADILEDGKNIDTMRNMNLCPGMTKSKIASKDRGTSLLEFIMDKANTLIENVQNKIVSLSDGETIELLENRKDKACNQLQDDANMLSELQMNRDDVFKLYLMEMNYDLAGSINEVSKLQDEMRKLQNDVGQSASNAIDLVQQHCTGLEKQIAEIFTARFLAIENYVNALQSHSEVIKDFHSMKKGGHNKDQLDVEEKQLMKNRPKKDWKNTETLFFKKRTLNIKDLSFGSLEQEAGIKFSRLFNSGASRQLSIQPMHSVENWHQQVARAVSQLNLPKPDYVYAIFRCGNLSSEDFVLNEETFLTEEGRTVELLAGRPNTADNFGSIEMILQKVQGNFLYLDLWQLEELEIPAGDEDIERIKLFDIYNAAR